MEKLTFLGVGPKIGRIALPYLAITITLTILFPGIFKFGNVLREPLLIAGIAFLVIALTLYYTTLRLLLPGIKNTHLVTTGPFHLCRNPLYAALLLFLVPGLGLLMNSWIILTTTIIGYLAFRRFIHEEEDLLDSIFGNEYRNYKNKTSQFFLNPFP